MALSPSTHEYDVLTSDVVRKADRRPGPQLPILPHSGLALTTRLANMYWSLTCCQKCIKAIHEKLHIPEATNYIHLLVLVQETPALMAMYRYAPQTQYVGV